MAAAVPFLLVASAAVSAYGAIQQGRAASAASNYNAAMARQNAALARQEAADLITQQQRENYLRLGAIRAAQGKSGGQAGAGSVLDILGDAAAQGELERQNIVRAGEIKAANYQNSAALDQYKAKYATQASYLQAGSDLLGGAANYYYSENQLKRA